VVQGSPAPTEQPDEPDVRLGEQRPDTPQQGVVEQLEVLMDEHQRLETSQLGRLVHQLVVRLLNRIEAVTGQELGARLGHAADPRQRDRLEHGAVVDGRAEDDHDTDV
jgi:hypothetical protein